MNSILFDETTTAFVYGLQANPIQRMLDFDFLSRRKIPSVTAVINPSASGIHQAFFGSREIFIPMYRTITEACKKHPPVSVLVNFASFRSAFETTQEALNQKTLRTIIIIAEGVPERQTRELAAQAKKDGKWLIGPATVGGMLAGGFRIGNTGGSLDNIIASRLYRPGSVGFVSKSGGMSNEMFNVIARNSNGIYEGIAIGGDKFPCTSLLDHLLRFEQNPRISMLVALGELGGEDEYDIVDALQQKKISKPLVIWVTGTCASVFPSEVQFGHAGAKSGARKESAEAKNEALRKAGAMVPSSFDGLPNAISQTYEKLLKMGQVKKMVEPPVPALPIDFKTALAEGKIRKPAGIVSSISDDRGNEVTYNKVPLSKLFEEDASIGDVISLLWLKKRLPKYASRYIELVLMTVADHGPAVSGAHNAIVASRAGKDLVSSLASGMLTIGPRFGGAIDDAARYFKMGKESGMTPREFVNDMKRKGMLIPGIGHRIKSVQNPDARVELLKAYAKKHFPKTDYLDFALEVEKITTSKRNNLILNVDGSIGVMFLDLLSSCPEISPDEFEEAIDLGILNGLFVIGRSIGMVGHVIDQKRLKQRLYRHPFDDILYV
ncbi:ATP citrate synthase [Candidatus Micrarchaeota archaeon]|nr:ATP citrate synthase [Candidatus Micrarchaeota archaeon]